MTFVPMDPDLLGSLKARRSLLSDELTRSIRARDEIEEKITSLRHEFELVEGLVNGSKPQPSPAGGVTLLDLDPPPNTRGPASIRFPNGEERRLGQWNKLLLEVAKYLRDQGLLAKLSLPVKVPGASRLLISDKKVHPNGRDFFLPIDLGNGLWLETHASALNLTNQARHLVKACGEDPRQYVITE